MNIMAAFIYGAIFVVMLSNLIYMMVDAKRMRRESEKLDKIGEDILKDIEVGQLYIDKYNEIEERLNKLETKKTSKSKKEEV